MRRTYQSRSGAFVRSAEGEQGFWPSYADMMSAVALILFFLMLLSYIQNLITGNDLQNTQEVLAETRATLDLTLKQVEEAESELEKVTIDLAEAKLTLDEQKGKLDEQSAQLAAQKDELASQDKLLAEQKALIGEQAEYLKAANKELLEMRSRMETIAVLRLSILEKIRDAMAEVMGDRSRVSIGENGSILLDESILFDTGSSNIKNEAGPALDQLITVFTQFLSNDENTRYVDTIVIAGHTDSTDSDARNRRLSTDRANSVLDYLMSHAGGALSRYASYFSAAGYGESRPVATNDTAQGRAANRRIEISIILRDDSIMDIVDQYLELEVPGVTVVPAAP